MKHQRINTNVFLLSLSKFS